VKRPERLPDREGSGDTLRAGVVEAQARARAACSWLDHGLAGDIALSDAIAAALRLLAQAVVWLLYAAGLVPVRRAVL
jgi:hypothetical protein